VQNNTNTKATVLFDLIRGRRSIRRYTPEAIPKEVILHLIEAATWAPSAHNRQPWRFVAITQPEVKERLARAMGNRLRADRTADGDDPDAIERDVARSYARLTGAPVLFPGENHNFTGKASHYAERLRLVIDWFEKYRD